MHVAVEYQDERLDFELPEDHVVASWVGPPGLEPSRGVEALRGALERPLDYPPLRRIVVPGDRLVIAFDQTIAPARGFLEAITQTLDEAGVGPDNITVVAPRDGAGLEDALPPGVTLVVHDPDDRGELAYLATTKQGRRIYLNRHLTDADVVVPVARLGYDPVVGYRGPWSLLFPELSDRATIKAIRSQSSRETANNPRSRALPKLDESFEVSWLLGSQFHVGLVPASTGFIEAVAGRETTVRDSGLEALDRHWQFQAASAPIWLWWGSVSLVFRQPWRILRRGCSRPLVWSAMAARSSRCRGRRASSARRYGGSAVSTTPKKRRRGSVATNRTTTTSSRATWHRH